MMRLIPLADPPTITWRGSRPDEDAIRTVMMLWATRTTAEAESDDSADRTQPLGVTRRQMTLAAPPPAPLAYLITMSTYGTWLHGDSRGSMMRAHGETQYVAPEASLVSAINVGLREPPFALDHDRRAMVLESLREICVHRGWRLYAAHVRRLHVHTVVAAPVAVERVVADMKARATRCLRETDLALPDATVWTRHASTRYLWDWEAVESAIRYVVDEQGPTMAVFEEPLAGPK